MIPDISTPPNRVVSLVPSLTESLFDLGLGKVLVGITDYCVYPQEGVKGLPRVGGTKDPRVDDILALRPELVLANREENTRLTVEALQAAGVRVWVTHPRTVREALEVLWGLVHIFHHPAATQQIVVLEKALAWAQLSTPHPLVRYFCPIWYEKVEGGRSWWMTFNADTYSHDVLRILGGDNIFAGRERRYPLEADIGEALPEEAGDRDRRYPRVTSEEVLAGLPELILLPDEPFPFGEVHRRIVNELFAGMPAVEQGRVKLMDGSLITWHGTRLGRALRELPGVLVEV
ncbi:MAG: helical backbone metal receptor [Chloroflexota bacterium]